jgi:hypothetical protein
MKKSLVSLAALVFSASALAEPEYASVEMSINVADSAEAVWSKVGADYCSISDWLGIDCTISEGEGEIGTVRVLAGGRITEIMVAKTPLSYGYTQPAVAGEFHNLYHGFMEARPIDANNTELRYTVMLDVSNHADQAAKDEDLARRRATFERALGNMKAMVEGE